MVNINFIDVLIARKDIVQNYKYARVFKDPDVDDVSLVGGKASSPGNIYSELSKQGEKVSNGFSIMADAYRYIMDKSDAWHGLHKALNGIDTANVTYLEGRISWKRVMNQTL